MNRLTTIFVISSVYLTGSTSSDSSLNFFDVSLLRKFKELYSLHVFCIDCSKFVVSSKFSGFYTPQNPSKTGLFDAFISQWTSLWGRGGRRGLLGSR